MERASYVTASYVTASYLTASYVTASYVTASDVTASDVTASGVTASYVTAPYVTGAAERYSYCRDGARPHARRGLAAGRVHEAPRRQGPGELGARVGAGLWLGLVLRQEYTKLHGSKDLVV